MLPKTNWCATDLTKSLITDNPVISFKIGYHYTSKPQGKCNKHQFKLTCEELHISTFKKV